MNRCVHWDCLSVSMNHCPHFDAFNGKVCGIPTKVQLAIWIKTHCNTQTISLFTGSQIQESLMLILVKINSEKNR